MQRISFLACAPGAVCCKDRALLRAGRTAQASRAEYVPSALALPIGWSSGIWLSSSGSIPRRIAGTGGAYRLDIADLAAVDLNGSDLQCICIDAQVELAPLPWLGRPVFLGEPFTCALDPAAVDQLMQRTGAGPIGYDDVQAFLAARQRAEIRNRPIEPGQSSGKLSPGLFF